MNIRSELLGASDETIEDAVTYADPMVLRGILHQLTGDESVAETEVALVSGGLFDVATVTDPTDLAMIRAKAAVLLKSYRDSGAGEMSFGPHERLRRSLSLTAGQEIPESDMGLWTEQLALDPWSRGLDWSTPPAPEALREFSVLVIGAGMGGLNAAVQLKHAGISFTVLEKNSEVGGTWHENRYPGARVDTPSRGYTHVYGVDFAYPNPFCPQSENERYFNWVADNFGVREDIEFDTEVKSVIWDEAAELWAIEAVGPQGRVSMRVNAVISAVGFLSRPNVPDIEGAHDFDGELFHTARWPSDLDLTGKRVAVIGSGCSSYQLLPEVGGRAAHTDLYQRTPSWCFETSGYLSPFPPQVNWLDRNLPFHTNFMRFRSGWFMGPDVLGRAMDAEPVQNARIRERRLAFIDRKLADRPDLVARMVPEAPPMSSRPVLVDEAYCVYDVLSRDDAGLVSEPIERITAGGIVTADGTERDYDVIVYATGFKANEYLWPMEFRGRDGLGIEELWAQDGARAYLGTMVPGFPNFFMIYGPNTNPTGGLGVCEFEELVTRFAIECMSHLVVTGNRSVDVTTDAYWSYNHELDKAEHTKMYSHELVTNYYKNEHGRSACNCPFDGRKMWAWLRDPTGEHRDAVEAPVNADSAVRPYFGQDLVVG